MSKDSNQYTLDNHRLKRTIETIRKSGLPEITGQTAEKIVERFTMLENILRKAKNADQN